MAYRDTTAKLAEYRKEIGALREKMRALQKAVEPEPVADYRFASGSGPVALSDLFDGKDTLIVIHNMGRSCPACTMWADGFNGVLPHLQDRAAFAVATPDDPKTQAEFGGGRGWRFRMVSHQGTDFAEKMGYRSPEGGWLPGVSVFRKQAGGIVRVSDTRFGPGDDFCTTYHFLDLIPEGDDGWRPKFSYQG
jgi:predicted dithiol-disulfide oxidoreductase (DUF899 family)